MMFYSVPAIGATVCESESCKRAAVLDAQAYLKGTLPREAIDALQNAITERRYQCHWCGCVDLAEYRRERHRAVIKSYPYYPC